MNEDKYPFAWAIVILTLFLVIMGIVGASETEQKRQFEYCLEELTEEQTIKEYKECLRIRRGE